MSKGSDFTVGKRYWFRNNRQVYSGLLEGRHSEHSDFYILVRKNGDTWMINENNLYPSKEALLSQFKDAKTLKIIG